MLVSATSPAYTRQLRGSNEKYLHNIAPSSRLLQEEGSEFATDDDVIEAELEKEEAMKDQDEINPETSQTPSQEVEEVSDNEIEEIPVNRNEENEENKDMNKDENKDMNKDDNKEMIAEEDISEQEKNEENVDMEKNEEVDGENDDVAKVFDSVMEEANSMQSPTDKEWEQLLHVAKDPLYQYQSEQQGQLDSIAKDIVPEDADDESELESEANRNNENNSEVDSSDRDEPDVAVDEESDVVNEEILESIEEIDDEMEEDKSVDDESVLEVIGIEEDETVEDNDMEEDETIEDNNVEDESIEENDIEEDEAVEKNNMEEDETVEDNNAEEDETIENNDMEEDEIVEDNDMEENETIEDNNVEEDETIEDNKMEEDETIEDNGTKEDETNMDNDMKQDKIIDGGKAVEIEFDDVYPNDNTPTPFIDTSLPWHEQINIPYVEKKSMTYDIVLGCIIALTFTIVVLVGFCVLNQCFDCSNILCCLYGEKDHPHHWNQRRRTRKRYPLKDNYHHSNFLSRWFGERGQQVHSSVVDTPEQFHKRERQSLMKSKRGTTSVDSWGTDESDFEDHEDDYGELPEMDPDADRLEYGESIDSDFDDDVDYSLIDKETGRYEENQIDTAANQYFSEDRVKKFFSSANTVASDSDESSDSDSSDTPLDLEMIEKKMVKSIENANAFTGKK